LNVPISDVRITRGNIPLLSKTAALLKTLSLKNACDSVITLTRLTVQTKGHY